MHHSSVEISRLDGTGRERHEKGVKRANEIAKDVRWDDYVAVTDEGHICEQVWGKLRRPRRHC